MRRLGHDPRGTAYIQRDVAIGKSLSLIGHNRRNTVIDATNLSNGIYIDGNDHPGLSNVVVSGCPSSASPARRTRSI
jgi:hypothetical protein